MIGRVLLVNAVLLFIYMVLWFLLARARKRLDTVDTAWGLGFVVAAWSAAVQEPTSRSLLIAVLVSIWGIRLANHIYQRSKNRGDDPRYVEMSKKWKGSLWRKAFWVVFMFQGLLIWIVSLPVVTATGIGHGAGWLTSIGLVIWLVGFAFESISDKQLGDFLKRSNHPKVMDKGLWGYSRHPNYFGELTQWWAIGIIATQAHLGWIGLLGPLVLTTTIVFISGIPPIERKRKQNPDYQEYAKRVSVLIPLPPRRTV
jgi:steroid 5-alpha reductase family enzyme